MHRWKALRYIVTIFIVGIAIYKIYPHLHSLNHLNKLKDANPFWIILAILTQILQYGSDGYLSQILLKIINFRIRLKDTLRIASLDIFASHLLPLGRVGSLTAVYYFYNKLGVDPEAIVFQVTCWAAVTTSVLLFIFFFSFLLLPQDVAYLPTGVRSLSIFFLFLIFIFLSLYLVTKKRAIRSFIRKHLTSYQWSRPFFTFLKKWQTYKKLALSNPMILFQAFLAASVYYIADIATLGFSFLAFGVLPPVPLLTFAYTTSLIAGLLILTPSGLGATDAALVLIFLSAKIDPVIALGATIVFRLITFWLPIPAGAISYFTLKREIKKKSR